ncbi:hypothetical protein Tco_0870945 [Tanacetum coccineum]
MLVLLVLLKVQMLVNHLLSILDDASTLPNADLPIDPNMPDLEDVSNAFLICTDIANIIKKQPKPDKHGHGNG